MDYSFACGLKRRINKESLGKLGNLKKLGRRYRHLSLSSLHSLNSLNSLINLHPVSTPPISCQSGANVALTRESLDGTYRVYFPFRLLTEASQERRYHRNSEFVVRSGLIWFIVKMVSMGCTLAYCSLTPFLGWAEGGYLSRQINFLSEGVRCGLDKEIALDGTYLKYFPFRAMIERSQMTPYHKKFLKLLLGSSPIYPWRALPALQYLAQHRGHH